MNSSQSPEYFNQRELERLAQNPKNQVYTYVNDEATAKFTAHQQRQYTTYIRSRYLQIRSAQPNLSDYQIREEINQEKSVKLFSENNTRIFETLTNRDSSQDYVNHIRYMIYLREQQENGAITEVMAQQMIQDYLVTAFNTGMTPQQYEKMKKQ
jgi:hypothetical protein